MTRINPGLYFLFLLFSCEQKDPEVPANVQQTFAQNYPTAENAEWAAKESSYEVNFEHNELTLEAEFTEDGEQIQEERLIDETELPPAIKAYLKENYPQQFIGEASIEQKGEVVVYELELLTGFFREIELEFDMDGNFLNKESFKDH